MQFCITLLTFGGTTQLKIHSEDVAKDFWEGL